MAKERIKTMPYLQGDVALAKILGQRKDVTKVGELKGVEIRLRKKPNKKIAYWRQNFTNGELGLCEMSSGKVCFVNNEDILSCKAIGQKLKISKQDYQLKQFDGQQPFYFR